jgi:acetyltransferase-like isoleucine patch superfamily enzyme
LPGWTGRSHKWFKDARDKAYTLLWYRFLFYSIGSNSSVAPPFYTYRPEFIELGSRVSIGPHCRIEAYPVNPDTDNPIPILRMGDRVRLGHGVLLSCRESLVIEDEVLIAGGCYVSDNNHSTDPRHGSYRDQLVLSSPTRIGKGAWLGQNVCVLAGSNIGECSVIGAGSVVHGHIPAYCVAVGVPARVVKQYCFTTKKWVRVNSLKKKRMARAVFEVK